MTQSECSSDTKGSFDNDVSIESFIEDMMHFCSITRKMAQDGCLEGPWKSANLTFEQLEATWKLLEEASVTHKDDETPVTHDFDHPVVAKCHEVVTTFHIALMNFHCKNFFPYHKYLTKSYENYINAFLENVAADYKEAFITQLDREYSLSPYTYSHRVKGDKLNSTRLSFGVSLYPTQKMVETAKAVLEEHGILKRLPKAFQMEPKSAEGEGDFFFYGLGWDFMGISPEEKVSDEMKQAAVEGSQLKIYFHGKIDDLSESEKRKVEDCKKNYLREGKDFMEHTLVAFNCSSKGDSMEYKLYLYPNSASDVTGHEIPSWTLNCACVVSTGDDSRGCFWQYDVEHTPAPAFDCPIWRDRLNCHGQAIYDKYFEKGMRLDTLGWVSPNDFTVYFPFEP